MKKCFLIAFGIMGLQGCKEKMKNTEEAHPPISSVFDAYYEDGLKLNLLSNTLIAIKKLKPLKVIKNSFGNRLKFPDGAIN
ncbi:MAG: hypothetical protein MUO53_08370 [Maribacter sp.]|nr:hypothetical protein [Maribacter sp.]